MTLPRLIASIACGLALQPLSFSNVPAQACGRAFTEISVLNAEGKSVANATIELVASLPLEDFKDFTTRRGDGQTAYSSYKLSSDDAAELLKRGVPLARTGDFCGNPLKQRANSTPVKNPRSVSGSQPSVKNFGFCSWENDSRVELLKVSAPGYQTDYYVGIYLGGCGRSDRLVLSKA